MKHRISFLIFGFLIVFFCAPTCWALLDSISPDAIEKGMAQAASHHAWHWLAAGIQWLAQICLNLFFMVYNYLGGILIYTPDVTKEASWGAISKGFQHQVFTDVQNVANIFKWLGFIVLFIGNVLYLSKVALGISKETLGLHTFIRFFLPLVILFNFSVIASFSASLVTNGGYFIFHQNSLSTTGVLEGLQNLTVTQGQATSESTSGIYRQHFYDDVTLAKDLAFGIAVLFAGLGIIFGWQRAASGAQGGWNTLVISMGALLLILVMPSIMTVFTKNIISGTADTSVVPSTTTMPFNIPYEQSVNTAVNVAPGQTPIAADPNQNNDQPGPDYHPEDTLGNMVGNVLRIVVAFTGVAVVFSVLLAKLYNVFLIAVLSVLGFLLIGFWGHPSTEQTAISFIKYWITLHLYPIIWAVGLFFLSHFIHLQMSPTGYGVGLGNILSACAIIAALWFIRSPEKVISLFANFQMGSAGTGKEFMQTGMAMLRTAAAIGTAGATLATGEAVQKLAASAGAVGGATFGGIKGAEMGANAAGSAVQAMNNIAKKAGGGGGKNQQPSSTDWGSYGKNYATPTGDGSSGGAEIGGSAVANSKISNRSAGSTGGGGGFSSGGKQVDFTKGGWPTNKGYENINKALGTNFQPTPLNSPREYAERDAEWRKSVSGSDKEWINPQEYDKSNPEHANYSQNRWKDIMDNHGKDA